MNQPATIQFQEWSCRKLIAPNQDIWAQLHCTAL